MFATGYDVHLTGPPYPVTGIGGRSLGQEWATGAQAYKSINAHGYPNLFFMTGPNSGPGHNSLLVYVEGQLDYAVRGITHRPRRELALPGRARRCPARYNERIQKRLTKTTWMSGCSSWYLTADGFNASMYPGFATQYLRQMRDFRFADYDAVARDATPASMLACAHERRPDVPAAGGRGRRPVISAILRRQVRRGSRDVIETAVSQLFDAAVQPHGVAASGEYRIDDLARLAGTTTRNIRVYRDRGLLHPPLRVGRLALYNDTHLIRLRLITSLLDRGYNIAHVHEMLSAWEQGKDLGSVLGLESAIAGTWAAEKPRPMPIAEAGDSSTTCRIRSAGRLGTDPHRGRRRHRGAAQADRGLQ